MFANSNLSKAAPPATLERLEKLEQLRALENGYPIRVVETEYESLGVDTPADLERARHVIAGASIPNPKS